MMNEDGCKAQRYINMQKYRSLRKSRRDYRLDAYLYTYAEGSGIFEIIKSPGTNPAERAIGNAEALVTD